MKNMYCTSNKNVKGLIILKKMKYEDIRLVFFYLKNVVSSTLLVMFKAKRLDCLVLGFWIFN